MRLYLGAISVVMAMGASTAQDDNCKMFSDWENTFIQSIALQANVTQEQLKELPIDQIFEPFDTILPSVSKCIASWDTATMMQAIAQDSMMGTCMTAMNEVDEPDGDDMDAALRSTICPMFETIVPCVNDLLLKYVELAMENGAECCTDLKTTIQSSYGSSLRDMAKTLMEHVGNVLCSTKKYVNAENKEVEEFCGASVVMMLFEAMYAGKMTDMVQVSHAGACDAMNGKEFSLTDNAQTKTKMSFQASAPTGICYKPIDELLHLIASYPIMQSMEITNGASTFDMADIFVPEKCLKGEDLIMWGMTENGMVMKGLRLVDETMHIAKHAMAQMSSSDHDGDDMYPKHNMTTNSTDSSNTTMHDNPMNMTDTRGGNITDMVRHAMEAMKPGMENLCFNLPHNVSQDCDFGTATLSTLFNTETEPTVTPTPDSSSATVIVSVASALVALVALMY